MKKKYLYNGEYYTEAEMTDFAKQSGVSFDSYIAALGKDVKVLDAPYEYKGNFYTQDEISAAAKKKGINDDAYLSQNGIKKKEEAYTGGAMSSAASKIGGQVGNFVGQSEKDNALSLIQSINAGITKGIEKGKQQFPNEIRATPEEEAALRDAQRRTGQADGLFTQQGAEQFNLLATDPLRAILDPEREKLQTAYNNRRLQGVRQTSDNTIARNNIDPNKTVQKKDGKLIPDVSSNPEYQVKNQEQALENVSGLVKNKFFKNGKEALEYAENQVKSGIDPTGNETIEHAITKAGEYKQKEESALNGKSIIQNAIEIQLQNDPLFKKQYETIINGTASDAEIADVARRFNIPLDKLKTQGSLPQEVVGELVHRFISDPDIKQIAEDNPEFKKDFDNFTGDKIYEVFPEYADVYIKNTLSRARELDGKNNWFANPIFDKSKYMDNLAEEVFKDRPILLKRVKDKFHNNWEHKIETTGIVDDLATGARGAMSGMWRSLKDVSGFGESYSDRIRNTLKEQYGHVETPHQNEFRKVVGEASNFMGMVLAMGATGSGLGNIGKGLGVMNPSVASKAVTLATFFDDELNHAASIYPENPTKAYLRASLSTAFFLVAGDAIPASKITGFKQNITQTLKSLETKALDKQAKMKLRDKILSVATETLQGTAKGTAEMTVMINGFKLLIDRALGLDESSINNEYSDANLLATAKSMLFGLPVPSMIHGFKGINRTRAAIYEMASNPEKYKSAILKRFGSDDHRIADIDFIADFKKYLDSMRVAENEKAKMVFNALHAKRLREQKSPDAFMKRNHEEEIRAIEQEQQDIMDGKDSDAGLTDSQKAIKTAYENGEINEMMEAQIKEALKDPAKADQFIKEIAEQATGAVAPELGNAKDGAIKFFGETLTDFAIGKSGKKDGGESVVFEYENEGEVPQKLKPLMVKDENGRITITMPKDEADALQKRIAEGLEPDMELMDGTLVKKTSTTEPVSPIPTEQAEALGEQVKARMGDQVSEGTNKEALEYAMEKVAEAPIEARKQLGDELFEKVLEATPTEKLQEGLDFLIDKNSDDPNVKELDRIISEREKKGSTPEQKSDWQKEQEAIDNDNTLSEAEKEEKKIESTAKALDDKYYEDKRIGKQKQLEIIDLIPKEQIDNPNENGFYRVSKMGDAWVSKQPNEVQEKVKKLNELFKDRQKEQIISEAYHKALKDGSNPELVKAVEELLSKEQATQEVKAEQPTVPQKESAGKEVGSGVGGDVEMTYEEKKADIEKRRQEELSKFQGRENWGKREEINQEHDAELDKLRDNTPEGIEEKRQEHLKKSKQDHPDNWGQTTDNGDGTQSVNYTGKKFKDGMSVEATFVDLGGVGDMVDGEYMPVENPYEMIISTDKPAIIGEDGIFKKGAVVKVGKFKDKASADEWLKNEKEKRIESQPKRESKINAKYDAELQSLSTQEGSGVGGDVKLKSGTSDIGNGLTVVKEIGNDEKFPKVKIVLKDSNGKSVSQFDGFITSDNTIHPSSILTFEGNRRKGYATKIYDYLKEQGYDVTESKSITDEGKLFRKGREGKAVEQSLKETTKAETKPTDVPKVEGSGVGGDVGDFKVIDRPFLEKKISNIGEAPNLEQIRNDDVAKQKKAHDDKMAIVDKVKGMSEKEYQQYYNETNPDNLPSHPLGLRNTKQATISQFEGDFKPTDYEASDAKKKHGEKILDAIGSVDNITERLTEKNQLTPEKQTALSNQRNKLEKQLNDLGIELYTPEKNTPLEVGKVKVVEADKSGSDNVVEVVRLGLIDKKTGQVIKEAEIITGKAVEQSLKETTKAETPTTSNTGVAEGSGGVGGDMKRKPILFEDKNGNKIVFEKGDYRISVDDENYARNIVLWHREKVNGKEYWAKRGVLNANIKESRYSEEGDKDFAKYLSISEVEIEKDHRGQGLSTQLYKALINYSGDDIKAILSYTPSRVNKTQVPKIWKRLGGRTSKFSEDYQIIDINRTKKAVEQSLKETTKAGSVGVGGDVKQQELDAQKINKEAGVDVYVARQGVETNGEKYTLSQIKENGNTNTFVIEDANGSEIGKAQLSADGNYLENIRIDENHRRKGLASKVYDFIELRKGIELQPSPNKQSKEAKALWDNRNLKKSVSNKANGGLLAKSLGEAMSKTFADFKNKQQVLLELENKYFEQKGLSKEDFNKLSETEKAEIIKDAVKWKNDNPELVKAVEELLGKKEEVKSEQKAEKPTEQKPTIEQQVKTFGVADKLIKPVTEVANALFSGLKKVGLTAAKNVGEWVGIGKGTEKPYSLKIDGKDTQVKNVQPEVVNGFYSPLEKIITESKFDKLPAKQWAEKYANSEEAKWTGLKDWLAKQQGSVSKADIQQYLKDNRIQVVEVVNSGKSEKYNQLVEEQKNASRELDILESDSDNWSDENYKESRDKKYELNDKIKELSNKIKEEESKTKDTKFENYQLEGEKENYKEVLVTMPSRTPNYTPITELPSGYDITFDSRNNTYAVIEENQTSGKSITGRYHNTKEDAVKNAIEVINAQRKNVITGKAFDNQFKSSHFDEPNILVHLRMNTRVDAEGKKVLFLEEVQSDWGQKGKKEGFANIDRLPEGYRIDEPTKFSKWTVVEPSGVDGNIQSTTIGQGETKEIAVQNALNNLNRRKTVSAPFVTDTNSWVKLGLKVALKEAVAQGVDKIAWGTGEQQNERYDLSKQVDEISTKKYPDGTYTIIGYKDGNSVLEHNDVPENKLEEYVGKDLAKKISDKHNEEVSFRKGAIKEFQDFQNELQDSYGKAEVRTLESYLRHPNNENSAESKKYFSLMLEAKKEYEGVNKDDVWNSFRGVDLKVGGKGMKGFYGSPTEGSLGIVGNVAKSLFKQEPKTVNIEGKKDLKNEERIKYLQHFVDELPQLEKSVSENKLPFTEQELDNSIEKGSITNESYKQGIKQLKKYEESVAKYNEYKERVDEYNKLKFGTTQHSIDITPELKASVEGGQPLFKDAEAQYRIESGKNIVEAIKDFNGSPRATVALTHEIMHPTVVAIIDGAKEGNETGLRHANTIVEEYNKANPDKKVTVQQMIEGNDAFINGRTTPEYRAVQEFIAEAWEKYHHEGAKGFSKAFQEVLDAITEVFRQVYKSLTGTTLTPELRKMFDELLGKENVSEVVKAPEISSKAKNKFSNLREKIKQKQSLKIVSDEAENRHANSKLTEADNPVQEPNVKALESEGENAKNAAQAENVIIKIDSIISAATDVGLRKVSDISTDEKRFQGRDKLNAEKVQEIAENWKDADQDPIHVWTDPKDGKTYVLSGHHRLAAAKQAGREKVKVIDRSKDFTEEQAIRFAKEEANANRTMETAIERANTLRQKRERGDTKDDINKFLDREGKNKNFVNNLSRLNPKGKTIEALRATEKSDDKVTQKEVEKIADWIGEARDRNKNLTDAHENELFDFLMDREGSKRITTKQDFLSKVNSLAGAMDFNANEPLNIARYKHKTEGEKLYDKEAETQKGKISDLQQRINEINDRIKNPNNPQYLNPDSKDYEEIKKNADNKLSELNTELQAESKALLDLYQQKGKFARQGTEQSSLFSTEKNETELPEDYYNDLRDIIKDLKDEHKGITLDEIKEIAKNELGEYYSEPDIEAAYKMTEPQPPKSAPEPPKSAPSRPDKSVLTNIVNAENTPPEVKKKLTAHGLKYDPESHDEALQIARAVIDSLGIDAAVTEARARNFGGAVNTFIQTEALNALYKKEAQAKTAQEKYEAAEKFAEVSIALDEWARGDAGRGISALATFYQKSPLGMVLKENKSRKEEFNQWAKGKEESWDEFLERLNKTPEFSDYVSEKVQTELREERKKERSKFFKKVDDTLDKWINDLESGNVAFSSVVPPKLIAEALKGVKAAFKVGESATKIIGDAIDYISDKIGDNWDKDTFRAKIEKALNLRAEKTSVDRYADSLKKQIEELQKQIDAGSRNKNQSNKRQLTPEEQSLLDEKKRLQKELNDIDPKTTFAQRIQKQIDDIQRQIDAGKRDEKERKNKKEYSEEEKELQEKLKAKKAELEALSPLKNTESYKLAELDKFREKLKGLSEAEKDEVVSKAYKKLLDNGALDHADLREIIAKATGRGNLTEKQAARLQDLNETINTAEIAKQKHLKERTEQTLKDYHKAIDMAAKAKRDLANEFDKKTDYLKVLSSSIQGNTLGLLNVAVMNPLYNITTHLALRLPIGTVQSLLGLALGKAEMNTVFGKPMQAEFFGKGGRGFREAFKGLLTGMNRADYESKEIFSSQIRPNRSLRALLGKDNREDKMRWQEKLFHTFSVFPGATAETVFRLLNFGDKPMRYSASAATAAAFAKKYGIKFNTMDWKTFMEFPREIVKEMELAKGKSEKEAEQEAENVVRSIEKEGERSTMQQDNLFSDMLEKIFSGGKHEGAKNLAKTLTISPFVKIPSNVLWLGYNLVHPQIALAQAAAHTIRSYGYRGKGEIAKSKLQMREARYWMSVTMMGAALQAVMIPLIKAGIITAANDEDDSKKKRIADLTYQPQGMFNMTKFWAYLSGKNVNDVQGGFEIPLKYFGLPGALGNSLARDYKQLTPEQKENRRLLTDNLLELFDADDFKDIENGIFSSSSSLLQGLKGGDMTYYAGNMVNLFTNLIQPAAVSEFSRAAIPYRISGKFDNLGDKIKNDLSNRSALFRKLTGKYPKGKRNIWGEIIKKDDSYANRYFGFNNVTKDNFAQFIYEDAQKWDDEDFLPPTVSNSLGGKKLTAEQLDELEENIGLARKEFIRAYTNDIALIEELGKNYSDILGRDAKKAALKYLYQKGRKLGVDMFVSKHPEFENVVSEEEKQVEELLKDFKNLNLLSEDEVKEKIKGK